MGIQSLRARFVRLASEPDDPDEIRLRKTIGAVIVLLAIPTYFFYGLLYIAFDERPAGLAALTGGLVCSLIALSYVYRRRYAAHWFFFTTTTATTLALIHFLLGGFGDSAMVIIWLLTVPVLTIIADDPRRGLGWALVIAVLVLFAAFVDADLAKGNKFPPALVITLSVVNILGFAAYMLLAVFYYVWRIDVIGRLVVLEREARLRDLERASRHKSEFLANMSHELRTPLNAIMGFSEVLAERYFGELNEKQADYVNDIHGSGKHLLSLVNDILDLSKVEAGRMELELSEFDLPAALEGTMTLIRERAHRHGIALQLECRPQSFSLRADERKIRQVMLNLLSNAVKFTPDGGSVFVTASASGEIVEVAVSDSGAGIAPEDQVAVFEEFRQVGRNSARKAEGTGLGLPLAKRFVELHGGSISVKSALGTGSTFVIALPIRHGDAAVPVDSRGTPETLR